MTTGVVIIGRNEGERFERCLRSLVGRASPIVYVDSGSTDNSVGFAESHASSGVHVVRLDMSTPFTAARGPATPVWSGSCRQHPRRSSCSLSMVIARCGRVGWKLRLQSWTEM